MIDREHKRSVSRQAKLLGFSRGSVYDLPRPVSDCDMALMRRVDELHLNYPFAGNRVLQGLLREEGLGTGRRHVATLMKNVGIEAIYRRPNTSKPAPGHKIYPYLLRKMAVTQPNQVWAMDITYAPMAPGFVYLCAVVDWFSRRSCHGGCRSRWRHPFASKQPRKHWPVTATPPGLAVHLDGLHGGAEEG
ncbi:putative transposase [Pseudorhizobium tarimense]|uniref:Transposase n=1 Tax=Pseudorhizobium tarimense TaxID=1079109 RepID=A0ABV2H6C8_9HYPH|nr:IS3 family transposase [Pseudorhizobium tarimense]